ncbi:MAG: hypothetical protein II951_13760 [Bacteroidales bacterium]|nr:hypothetical protein [Bacteroidales bacterium]
MTSILAMNNSFRYHIFTLLIALLQLNLSSAQQPVVRAELDTVAIVIGDQVGLTVNVFSKKDMNVHVRQLRDSIGSNVEIIRQMSQDTTVENDLVTYTQRYLLTSFDTGLHYLPALAVAYTADGDSICTPELSLNVLNPFQKMEVDEASGINKICDINSAQDAPFQWRELLLYWPWFVLVLAVAALVFLAVWLKDKLKRPEGLKPVKVAPAEPCEVVAIRELERIKEEKLWQHNRVKDYYSDLTDTLRRYVSLRFGISALESTTSQLLDMLAPHLADDKDDLDKLEYILSQADFAKFAKLEPLSDENDKAMSNAFAFVEETTRRQHEKESAAAAANQNPKPSPDLNVVSKQESEVKDA